MAKKAGKNNTFLWGLAAVFALGIAGIVITLFLNLIQTETYYVLNEDVPTRTEISPDYLTPVQVSKGGAPVNALTIEDIQNGGVFTAHPLMAGDIITYSNIGNREDISVGIPDEWVVTNFSVDADSAAGGRIQRGYYFDILVTTASGSYYPFVNVLALDTTVDLSGASSSDAANTEEAKMGMTTQYVVGMTPENAAKLHYIMENSGGKVSLLLSPRANEYQKPVLSDYAGLFTFNPGDEPINLGEGTDATFTVLERDAFGRLIEELVNCSDGNAVISDSAVCETKGQAPKPVENTDEETDELNTPSPSESAIIQEETQ